MQTTTPDETKINAMEKFNLLWLIVLPHYMAIIVFAHFGENPFNTENNLVPNIKKQGLILWEFIRLYNNVWYITKYFTWWFSTNWEFMIF